MGQDNIVKESMLAVGTLLRDTYRIEGHLSSGGFGNTYVARHKYFDEQYAVKEFFMKGVSQRDGNNTTVSVSNPLNQEQFDEQKNKFRKEAQRLRRLHNPHIVAVNDLFDENGTAYYVMEYVDGESLADRLKRTGKPLSEAEVRDLLPQILDALEEVHNHNIWHLDLKPANIMVTRDGNVKIIDFGASKQLRAGGGATTTTALCYTPGYAPREQMEQTESSKSNIGPWTDFYALGATLYNLLTNRKPPMPLDIDDKGNDAFTFESSTSSQMRTLVTRLMKPNRRERPQNVSAIRPLLPTDTPSISPKLSTPSVSSDRDNTTEATLLTPSDDKKATTKKAITKKEPSTSSKDDSSSKSISPAKAVCALVLMIALFEVFLLLINKDNTVKNKEFSNGLFEYSYTGPVKNDLPNGKGFAIINSPTEVRGNTYEGNFVDGDFVDDNYNYDEEDLFAMVDSMPYYEGDAIYKYTNGDVYHGSFKHNRFNAGTLTQARDSAYFVGYFRNNETYNGEWYDKSGKMILIVKNGETMNVTGNETEESKPSGSLGSQQWVY